MRFLTLLAGIALPALSAAAHIRVLIPSSASIPNPSTLPPSTSASLTTISNTYVAPLDTSNAFAFRNVSDGSYLLDVHCPTHVFAPLRVDVTNGQVGAWGTFRGNEWSNKGEVVDVVVDNGGSRSFEVKALVEKNYYQERSGFSPLSILKNPMILIALVSMVIIFGMPKLLENMDPESLAELEEAQKSSPVAGLLGAGQPGAANPLGNFDAAAWLAGSGTKKDASPSGQEKGVTR